jgi:uncharacterized protein (DUF885 family)
LRIAVAVLILAAVLAAGPAAAADPHLALRALVAGYWEEVLSLDPLLATSLGDHRHDAELPVDLGAAHLARRLELERRALRGLAAIDATRLAGEDVATWQAFRDDRLIAIEGFRYQAELLPPDPDDGVPMRLAALGAGGDAQPFRTAADYERWLGRAAGFGPWVEQAIANLRRGVAKGIVAPRGVTLRLLAGLDAVVTADPSASVFYRPVTAFPPEVGIGDQGRLRLAYTLAIRDHLNPAYRRLRDFLRDEYLPATAATVSRAALPLGRDWYAYEVRRRTTTTLAPAAIHAIGLEEVRRLAADLDRAMADAGFHGERRAFLDGLAADPRQHYAAAEDLLAGYRTLKDTVASHRSQLFDLAPRGDFAIVAAAAAFDADGARPGVVYVGTADLAARLRYVADGAYLAEGEPGRQFQRAIALGRAELPAFRRYTLHEASVAGWDLYALSLGRELGLLADPAAYFGALAREEAAAALLVVDTGIHARGWTRDQALEYLGANTALGPAAATMAVDRAIAAPAAALGGTLGKLRIRELRARAERELGARFDVRAFHRAVLEAGSLPLGVLEGSIDAWIAAAKAAP